MNNVNLSHFKVGTEISEARKHIGSIYQYLCEPHIQDELFVEAIEKINKKRTEESDLITDDEEKKGLQSFLESGKILLEDKSFRLKILGKFKPIIQDLLGKVNEMLSTHPVKVNMAHILIVEGWFWISNINNKPNNDSIKFIDGRLVIPERKVDPVEELMDKRMALLKPDLMRRLASFKSQADNLSFDTEGGEEIAKDLLNGNLLSTDPMFGMYFAFTLSQCSVYDIKEFLNYQKSEFNGDFNDFLEITLIKYSQLLSNSQIQIVEKYIKSELINWKEDDSLGKVDLREIKIKKEYLPYIAGKLKPYFSEDDFLLLRLVLDGKSIKPQKIVFDGACSKLCYFFREMKNRGGVIQSTKLVIEKWLSDYVDFNKQSKEITPITPDMAHQYVSSTTKLKGKDTIDISDFEEFEKKANKTK